MPIGIAQKLLGSSWEEYCYSVEKEITHLCQLPILASAYNGACIWVNDDSLLQQHSLVIATRYGQLTVGTCEQLTRVLP